MKSKKYIGTMIAILLIFVAFRVYQNGFETLRDPMTLLFIGAVMFDLLIISGIVYLFQKYRAKKRKNNS